MSEPDFQYDPPPMPIARDMVCISRDEYNKLLALANTLGEALKKMELGYWPDQRAAMSNALAEYEAAKKEGLL